MSNPLTKKLRRRYAEQNGRCFWCGHLTAPPGASRAEVAEMFGLVRGAPNSRKEARQRTATVEHLLPKSHGGTDAWRNIVMACKGCNQARGDNLAWIPARAAAPR